MNSEKSVSVIVPTFNRKKLLIRAIDSVLEQTLPPLEIIVVDDHSDFDVERYLGNVYQRRNIIVIVNRENYGAAESRNVGVGHSQGKYIAFLDSDDYWSPRKLARQMEIACNHPAAGLIYCDQWVVDHSGAIHESGKELVDKDIWDHLLRGWTAPNTSTLLFKKDAFEELGGFDPGLTSCQDHDLWMRVAFSGVEVKYSPERLSYFTENAANRISLDYNNRVKGAMRFLEKWRKVIVASGGTRRYLRFKSDYVNKAVLPIFLSLIRNKDLTKALAVYTKHLVINPPFYTTILRLILALAYHKWLRLRSSLLCGV